MHHLCKAYPNFKLFMFYFETPKECPNDMYGDNCNTSCDCPVHADCDSVSGKCTCHDGFVGEMCTLQENRREHDQPNYTLVIYIILVGTMLCMTFVVRIALKAKQRISNSIIDGPKCNKRQQSGQPKAILTVSHRTITDLETNVTPIQNKDVYYEISDVDFVGAYQLNYLI
ncbi:MEGF10_11 [Mytilus coruscus]|uniref:MEGF10_11 n=1 Tax=Mytilus coruscus TaxID=42192 RepID=A0A6J8AM99_MYTCO|nr:MEGF10_11 [Mytilus coruscus]